MPGLSVGDSAAPLKATAPPSQQSRTQKWPSPWRLSWGDQRPPPPKPGLRRPLLLALSDDDEEEEEEEEEEEDDDDEEE